MIKKKTNFTAFLENLLMKKQQKDNEKGPNRWFPLRLPNFYSIIMIDFHLGLHSLKEVGHLDPEESRDD